MSDYDTDVVVWSARQSALLRRIASGEQINDQVDWPNIIEEVDTVGRSERSALSGCDNEYWVLPHFACCRHAKLRIEREPGANRIQPGHTSFVSTS